MQISSQHEQMCTPTAVSADSAHFDGLTTLEAFAEKVRFHPGNHSPEHPA